MKAPQILLWLLAFITTIHAFAIPSALESFTEASQSLFKRKGGGGGGRGGGGGTTSGGGSTGSGRGSTGSNSGGSTRTGSGTPKAYGSTYGGGASTPYTSGATTRGVTPYLLGGAALGFFPGVWLYGAYAYSWGHPWTYRNTTTNSTQTLPMQCLCAQYAECGCDDNNSTDYQTAIANNASISRVATVNGTQTLFVNGTLDNGTTSDGGDEDAYDSAASSLYKSSLEMSGFWVVIAGVVYSLWFM